MNIYRCTRQFPYTIGTLGYANSKNRQGYHKEANSHAEAFNLMKAEFPDEKIFTVELWTSDKNALQSADFYMEDGIRYSTNTREVAPIE